MTAPDHHSARLLFERALALLPPRRAEFLDDACRGESALRAQVDALLAAHDEAGDFLNRPAHVAAISEQPGQMVGRYKLLQPIGEGGFGSVWMAEQRDPVKRRVALKVIKLGMDTKQVIARFEAERQALALMDHPFIAKVLDAGATDAGRPYFVMELVRGVPIIEFCDRERLDTRARLDLFVGVCHAIQHAHQKGIIHRDIKPSNVLVTLHDGSPVPKVIDFGIAKAINAELTERTLFTEHRQMMGTPAYMSPEQAELSSLDIDTRADVYSLGVLLYELLTGTTPFDMRELLQQGLAAMLRVIREVEPHKPSTRISTLGGTGRRTAEQRHSDVKKLGSLLRGDLDWIVMRCLEKDRSRRYETANGLALDVRRHLDGEPVSAAPPGKVYRLRKFVARNKAGVLMAGVITGLLLLGVAGTSLAMFRALESESKERGLRTDAESARAAATQRAAETRQVADFQSKMLSQIDVEAMGRGIVSHLREQVRLGLERQSVGEWPNRRRLSAEEVSASLSRLDEETSPANPVDVARHVMGEYVLRPATEALRVQFADQALVQAQLSGAIATIYESLGSYDAAEPLYRQALALFRQEHGDEHIDVAATLDDLAWLLDSKGERADTEPLFRQALAVQRKLLGAENLEVASLLNNLAVHLKAKSQYTEAEALFREALAMRRKLQGEEHADVAFSMASLAELLRSMGNLVEAESMSRRASAMGRRLLGDEHPLVTRYQHNLAVILMGAGKNAEAEALLREVLVASRKRLGHEHPQIAPCLGLLGQLMHEKGDLAGAEALHREALAMARKFAGDENPDAAMHLIDLAWTLYAKQDYSSSEPLFRESLAMSKKLLSGEHENVAGALNGLALVLEKKGDAGGAEALFREALALSRRLHGRSHPSTAMILHNLARLLAARRDHTGAAPLLLEALDMGRTCLGDEHPHVRMFRTRLAQTYAALGRASDAEAVLREALEMERRRSPRDDGELADGLARLGVNLSLQDRHADAEAMLRESLDRFRECLPDDHPGVWRRFHALSLLGGALTAQSKFAEAEPLLLDGFSRMKDDLRVPEPAEGDERDRKREALQRIVTLYHSWDGTEPGRGRDAQTAQWTLRLAEYDAARR